MCGIELGEDQDGWMDAGKGQAGRDDLASNNRPALLAYIDRQLERERDQATSLVLFSFFNPLSLLTSSAPAI